MIRLKNEAALAIARKALEVVRPCLRPEEAGEAFREFYELAQCELDRFMEAADRQRKMLDPLGGGNGAADRGGSG